MAADYVRRKLGDRFVDELRRVTTGARVPETLARLGALPFAAVLTTAYDPAVEQAFARGGTLPPVFTPKDGAGVRAHGRGRFVFKLLGDPSRPDTVVWGAADLQTALAGGGYQPVAEELFRHRTFLLVGFDWIDAELSVLLERILSGAGGGGPHYAVLENLSPLERDELEAIYGIRVIDGVDTSTFVRDLHAAMSDHRRAVPDDDDLDAWLALLADDPTRPELVDRFDALEERLRRRGDPAKLVELWVGRTAVEADPRRRATLLADAAGLFERELADPPRAIAALLAAYEEQPSRALWEHLERLAASTGRFAELAATVAAHTGGLAAADRADAWARVAAIRDEELHEDAAALAATDEALKIDPGHRAALETKSALLRRAGRWKELSETLGRCVLVEESLTRRAELYTALGDVFDGNLGDPTQAAACYRLALEADPWTTTARAALEQLLFRRGAFADLIELYEERAERAAPTEQLALRRRIAELCEQSLADRALAIRHWEAVRALEPGDLVALQALQRLYEQEGRARDLLPLFTDAAARAGSDRDRAEILRKLAFEWERQPGGGAHAAESLEALLSIDPRDTAALAALERIYREGGRLHELGATLERHLAVAAEGERVPLHLELATVHESLGQLEHAESAYLEALRLRPDADVYARAGELACERLGDTAQGESLFARALELDPRHVPSLIGLAKVYRRQGNLLKAARLLGEAVDYTQNRLLRTRLLVESAEIHEWTEDAATALTLYRRALELDPDHVDAAARAGELLWRAGRYAELTPILEMLSRHDAPEPVQVERLSRLGKAALATGDRDRAQRALRRVLELDPTHLVALEMLAGLAFDAQAFTDAQPLYEALLHHHEPELSPAEQVEAYHRLGVCDLQAGRPDAARDKFDIACAIDPTHRPSRLLQLELGAGDPQALLDAKKALVATAPVSEQVKLYMEIGDLYLDHFEDPVQALGAWEAGLRVQPSDVRLLHRALNVLIEQKAWSQAMGVLDHLVRGEPKPQTRAKYHYTAGIICLEHLGRFADAADHLWASVTGDPSYKRAQAALEEMLRNHKSWKELARYYQFALRALEPVTTPAGAAEQLRLWTELGELYLERLHDPESAILAMQVALKLDPSAKRRQRLATVCMAAGGAHRAEAIAQHQALLREDPARVASYRALKELYVQLGETGHAQACAVALACLRPDEVEAPPPPPAATAIPRPLSMELLAGLRHPDEDADLSALFALLAGALVATRAQRDRQPLQRKRLVAEAATHPFARALHRAAAALGLPLPLVQAAPEQAEPATLLCPVEGTMVMPVLVLGRTLVDDQRPETELQFDVARRVAQLRPEHIIRYLLPLPHELAHLIEAAMSLASEAAGVSASGELGKTTAAFKRTLPPPALDRVVALGHRFRARLDEREWKPERAAFQWLQASDLTCNRIAYAIVGDLPRAARVIKHEGPLATALPPPQRILDLVWSSVTDEVYAAARALQP
jgi:tetratricopeptide (TPR) repeat protein